MTSYYVYDTGYSTLTYATYLSARTVRRVHRRTHSHMIDYSIIRVIYCI